jgi:hypothetical protein
MSWFRAELVRFAGVWVCCLCEERGEQTKWWGIGQVFISSLTPDSTSPPPLQSGAKRGPADLTIVLPYPLSAATPESAHSKRGVHRVAGPVPGVGWCVEAVVREWEGRNRRSLCWASMLRALCGREWAGGTWWVDTDADLVIVERRTAPVVRPILPDGNPGWHASGLDRDQFPSSFLAHPDPGAGH